MLERKRSDKKQISYPKSLSNKTSVKPVPKPKTLTPPAVTANTSTTETTDDSSNMIMDFFDGYAKEMKSNKKAGDVGTIIVTFH